MATQNATRPNAIKTKNRADNKKSPLQFNNAQNTPSHTFQQRRHLQRKQNIRDARIDTHSTRIQPQQINSPSSVSSPTTRNLQSSNINPQVMNPRKRLDFLEQRKKDRVQQANFTKERMQTMNSLKDYISPPADSSPEGKNAKNKLGRRLGDLRQQDRRLSVGDMGRQLIKRKTDILKKKAEEKAKKAAKELAKKASKKIGHWGARAFGRGSAIEFEGGAGWIWFITGFIETMIEAVLLIFPKPKPDAQQSLIMKAVDYMRPDTKDPAFWIADAPYMIIGLLFFVLLIIILQTVVVTIALILGVGTSIINFSLLGF